MSEIDYVIPALKIEQEAVFNFADLYKLMKSWFDFHRYDFYEREHVDISQEEAKSDFLKWEAERKVDDYVKFHIEMRIKLINVKEVHLKESMGVQGGINIKFESFLEKDYEDNWEKNFFIKFVRGLYDHFLLRDRFARYGNELKDETYDIFNQVKAFLRLRSVKA